jgi:hypothetical protein
MNPTTTNKLVRTYQSITIDGSDIEVTRFYEFMRDEWIKMNNPLFNFANVTWDNGHDVLRFETQCVIINMVEYLRGVSAHFPQAFIMYDYYTDENESEFQENVYWLFEGSVNTNKEEFNREL